MENDPVVRELQELTEELHAMTDKAWESQENGIPGFTEEDKARFKEINLRLRELNKQIL